MRKAAIAALCGLAIPALFAGQARAQDLGAPVELAEGVSLHPIFAARLRYETVDQDGFAENAEALTLRTRLGAELKLAGGFALLAEAEGTLALTDRYNDTLPGNGLEPFPVVADPESLELNRLQVSWAKNGSGVTLGRQRIVLDDARFVGNVGWRQNEQTFDAVRGQAKVGPLALNGTYAISQRTVFGADSPNGHFDGKMVLLNGGFDLPVFDAKAFAYLIDYDTRAAFSSQTYGVLAKAEIPLPAVGKLSGQASYARQTDYGANPVSYGADFWSAQLGFGVLGFTLTAGYEELGSDGETAAFQTPLATLHAFNGWADVFLTTPPQGLRDSDVGGLDYGSEWDASVGFKLGPIGLLAKYANYDAEQFAVDTEKLWLQAEVGF
jgi:hypothetical protein